MTRAEIEAEISVLLATRPYDGREVTLRENRGGWRYTGLTGTCVCMSDDGRRMVLSVEHCPDGYWPVGTDVLVYLDHETRAEFDAILS